MLLAADIKACWQKNYKWQLEYEIYFGQRIDSKSSSSIKKFTDTTLKTAKKCAKQWLNTYKKYTEEIQVVQDILNYTGKLVNYHTDV